MPKKTPVSPWEIPGKEGLGESAWATTCARKQRKNAAAEESHSRGVVAGG